MVANFPKPHYLTYTPYSGDSLQDDKGDWITPNAQSVTVACYAEVAGVQNKVPRQDGILVEFGWMVYTNHLPNIPTDTEVIISDSEGNFMGKGKVLRYSNGILGARLWV